MRGIHLRGAVRARRVRLLALPVVAIVGLAVAFLPEASRALTEATSTETSTETTTETTTGTTTPVAPAASVLPQILGTPVVGSTLTTTDGTWTGSPTAFTYQWLRCPADGGVADGSNCGVIPKATESAYQLTDADVGFRARVNVTATNAGGSATATSNPTNTVTAAPESGCPSGVGPIAIDTITPPARLLIDHGQVAPTTITGSTNSIVVRVHVSACGGRSVQGAIVYVAAIPFQQFGIPAEQATDTDGWVTFEMNRLSGFPSTLKQRLLVVFARARKADEKVVGGISTRRLLGAHIRVSR
jgi:hypothetical protein